MTAPTVTLEENLEKALSKEDLEKYEKELKKEETNKKERLKEWWHRREVDHARVAGAGKNQPSIDSFPKAFQAWLDLMFHLLPMIGDTAERTAKIGAYTLKETAQPGFKAIKEGTKATRKDLIEDTSTKNVNNLPIVPLIAAVYVVKNISAVAATITAEKLASMSPIFKDSIPVAGAKISQKITGKDTPTLHR